MSAESPGLGLAPRVHGERTPLRDEVVPREPLSERLVAGFQRLALLGAREAATPVLDELLAAVLETLRLGGGLVALLEGDVLRPVAACGVEAALARDALASATLAEPVPAGALQRGPVDELAWTPLLSGDRRVGVLLVRPGPEALLPAEEGFLATAATVAAAAVVRERAQTALQQAMRAREEVLGIVAHDLRNPINVIGLAANGLLNKVADAAVRRPLERIQRGAQRLERLIQGLLDVQAIEGGRFTISCAPVDPTALVLTAVDSQQSLAGDRSVILRTDLSPDLPPLEADEERLLEVFENLTGNALKFTAPGGTVSIEAARADLAGFVRFTVRDTGAGIAPEQLPHIFDRFWQAHASDRRGTGLGLTICKAIVESHGGRIWAESTPGVGTAVHFTVPTRAAPPRRMDATGEPASILLVDDIPDNLTALKAILESPGYRLVTASSGEEALRLALRERFAVALIDVAMPTMNGFDVAGHLKALERSKHIPIIFVTAFGDDPEEVHRAYAAGGADYLVKPLDAEIVRKKVAVFAELSRKRHDQEDGASSLSSTP